MSRSQIIEQERSAYATRMGACVAVALILVILAIRYWPVAPEEIQDMVFDARGQDLIQMEEILPTQQNQSRPPPPAPLTPVVVPDDTVLDEIQIELTDELVTADTGEDDQQEEEGSTAPVSGGATRPDSGPRAFLIVEPEIPPEAKRIRAEVVVEVLVNQRGMVESAQVVERFLLKGRDNSEREAVALLGYGLEEAALTAARGWKFRPAREDGKTVSSLYQVTLSFGV
ncbi:MAG: protein TonB [Rhodothermales bacterium]|jgi:protein TonB